MKKAKYKVTLSSVLKFLPKFSHMERAILLNILLRYEEIGKVKIHFNDLALMNVISFIASSDQSEFRSILKTVEERRAQ